jgi:hypothetical protein
MTDSPKIDKTNKRGITKNGCKQEQSDNRYSHYDGHEQKRTTVPTTFTTTAMAAGYHNEGKMP